VNKALFKVIIDSRATRNFISKGFVEKYKILYINKDKPVTVYTLEGKEF